MKALALSVLMVELCSTCPLAAATVRTASEAFVTNRIAAAVAAIPAPDFTTNNVVLTNTIAQVAPAPGDYATVSNRAINAVQTTDTDWLDAESKMGAITASGDEFFPWCFMGRAYFADELVRPGDGYNYHLVYDESAMRWITWYASPGSEDMIDEETGRFLTQEDIAYLSDIASAATAATNYTDVAIASIDIPESITPAVVTNIVRDLSSVGIWDSELEVWWTPKMRNGSLTYEATTNVNLNAEN